MGLPRIPYGILAMTGRKPPVITRHTALVAVSPRVKRLVVNDKGLPRNYFVISRNDELV